MSGFQRVMTHRMRAYYVPIAAGVLLIVSSFLPWMFLGETRTRRRARSSRILDSGTRPPRRHACRPDIWTRKNSRHPLLVVGLAAFAITFLGYQWLSRSVHETAWARSQAQAIVENVPAKPPEATAVGFGIYLGMAAALVLVGFGLTIVVKQVPRPYATSEDDA